MKQGCDTCRWASCHNYGKKLSPYIHYIKSLEQEKREELLINRKNQRTS